MESKLISGRPDLIYWLRNGLEKDIHIPRGYDATQDMLILAFCFPCVATVAVGIGPHSMHLSELFKQGGNEREAVQALTKSFLRGFIPQQNGEPFELGKKEKRKYSWFKAEANFESKDEFAHRKASSEHKEAGIMQIARLRNQIAATLPEFVVTQVKVIIVEPPAPQPAIGNLAGLFDKVLSGK